MKTLQASKRSTSSLSASEPGKSSETRASQYSINFKTIEGIIREQAKAAGCSRHALKKAFVENHLSHLELDKDVFNTRLNRQLRLHVKKGRLVQIGECFRLPQKVTKYKPESRVAPRARRNVDEEVQRETKVVEKGKGKEKAKAKAKAKPKAKERGKSEVSQEEAPNWRRGARSESLVSDDKRRKQSTDTKSSRLSPRSRATQQKTSESSKRGTAASRAEKIDTKRTDHPPKAKKSGSSAGTRRGRKIDAAPGGRRRKLAGDTASRNEVPKTEKRTVGDEASAEQSDGSWDLEYAGIDAERLDRQDSDSSPEESEVSSSSTNGSENRRVYAAFQHNFRSEDEAAGGSSQPQSDLAQSDDGEYRQVADIDVHFVSQRGRGRRGRGGGRTTTTAHRGKGKPNSGHGERRR